MTRRALLGAVAALGALVGIGPAAASAHPLLLQTAPQGGLVAPRSPEAIRLALSESAVARGSAIVVTGPRGARVPTTGVRVDRRTLSVTPRHALAAAVYTVRWSALGNDGHLVSGSFAFGVAGAGGAAPAGAERLLGAAAVNRGGEGTPGEGAVTVAARWLGILAASLLLGAFVLVTALRRRGAARDGAGTVRAAAPLAWLLLGLAVVEGLLAGATAGAGGDLDLGLLTAGATGRAELVRALVFAVTTVTLVPAARGRRPPDRRYAGGAAAVLLTYALSGHALSEPSFFTLLEQGVHVLTAGLWLGGVLAVVLVSTRGRVPAADAARAFAPVAGAALGVAILTGVLSAVHEVDGWYFLRWSDYGRVVLVKSALVAVTALLGAVAFLRSRHPQAEGPRPELLRAEALGVVGVVALAATLSGLVQGRGQALPAERGTLFAGPAFADALLPGGGVHVLLAPARRGANVLTASPAPEARTPRVVEARLACACSPRVVRARLVRGHDATWAAQVDLPADGPWYGYLRVDGVPAAAPVQLAAGVSSAPGAAPRSVLSIADLSGPDGDRCRSHVLGLGMAIARINAAGGVDGGHKVAATVLDSGGEARRARALVTRALAAGRPLALAGGCGVGAARAAAVAARAGVPVVVGDPTVGPLATPGVFGLAADPYAQGWAIAELIRTRVGASPPPGGAALRTLIASPRLAAGLRAGLAGTGYRPVAVRPGALAAAPSASVAALLGRDRTAAFVVDARDGGGADVAAIARAGREHEGIAPGPVFLSERVLSERLIRSAGSLGRIGALQGVTEVSPTTKDGILYAQAVPLLYRGELPTLDGLRGYVTGLALRDALRDGTDAADVTRALRHPRVFTDALLAPWSPRQPGTGSSSVLPVQPQFLSPTLVPAQIGGEGQDPSFFPDGRWAVTSGTPLGLRPGVAGPPV